VDAALAGLQNIGWVVVIGTVRYAVLIEQVEISDTGGANDLALTGFTLLSASETVLGVLVGAYRACLDALAGYFVEKMRVAEGLGKAV
jgi:hypothetical protein